ncbi:MAG: hypothetical protein JO256_13955 [Alphaproteobacteria bacterium]|nr:hypothetical protein [Alphaproteobacteria bacterium]
MEQYEIRLVPPEGGVKIFSSTYISDYAAMRSARMLAANDDRIEIWRGMHCIFQDKRDSAGEA